MPSGYGTGPRWHRAQRGGRSPTPTPTSQATTIVTPSAVARASTSAASPVAERISAVGTAATTIATAPAAASAASRGTSRSSPSSATATIGWRTTLVVPSHEAAKRPQPVTSPISQPIPRASGSQPTIAWTTRQRPRAVRSSVSARPRSAAAAAEIGHRRVDRVAGRAPGSPQAPGAGRRPDRGAARVGGGCVASAGPAVARHQDDVVCSGGGGGSGVAPDRGSRSSPSGVDAAGPSALVASLAAVSPGVGGVGVRPGPPRPAGRGPGTRVRACAGRRTPSG